MHEPGKPSSKVAKLKAELPRICFEDALECKALEVVQISLQHTDIQFAQAHRCQLWWLNIYSKKELQSHGQNALHSMKFSPRGQKFLEIIRTPTTRGD